MSDISRILALLKITIYGLCILLALIYVTLILCLRHFHHRLHILTMNICFSMICSSIFWTTYFFMWEYFIQDLFTLYTCTFLFYLQTISTCIVPLSLLTLTINRFCSIIYSTKAFFKTKKFMFICITIQWIVACLISLPFLIDIQPYCVIPQWLMIYTLIIAIIVPTVFVLILNLRIFKHVHASSRRIHAQKDANSMNVTMGQQLARISRRDMHLLRHTIFIFGIFILGWTPIFALVAMDYSGNVSALVYTILQILAVISSFVCMMDLLLYNRDIRQYLKNKLCFCFN